MRKLLFILLGIILTPFLLWLLYGATLLMLGYILADSPGSLAEQLVRGGRPAKDCFLYRTLDFGPRPTIYELQMECVRKYAELSKDPAACELLLPSEYGLSCISNLWPDVSDHEACGPNYIDPDIFECRDKQGVLHQSKRCSDFSNSEKQYSICISYIAEREKSLERCAEIPDPSIRSFCEVRMRAWQKYPELRGSFYFGSL